MTQADAEQRVQAIRDLAAAGRDHEALAEEHQLYRDALIECGALDMSPKALVKFVAAVLQSGNVDFLGFMEPVEEP